MSTCEIINRYSKNKSHTRRVACIQRASQVRSSPQTSRNYDVPTGSSPHQLLHHTGIGRNCIPIHQSINRWTSKDVIHLSQKLDNVKKWYEDTLTFHPCQESQPYSFGDRRPQCAADLLASGTAPQTTQSWNTLVAHLHGGTPQRSVIGLKYWVIDKTLQLIL